MPAAWHRSPKYILQYNKLYLQESEASMRDHSIMVRRGNQRVKKLHSNAPAQSSAAVTPQLPFGTLGGGTGNNNPNTLRQYGIEVCPQCQTPFNSTNCRPVQEACGHIKCRTCFISNDDGCPQCNAERPRKGASNTSLHDQDMESRVEDLDLMPPLLTVEEPIACGKGMMAIGQPPVLSSITSPKPALKRRQSKDLSPSAPIKVQKTTMNSRSPMKIVKESDSRERPKGRRSSFNSSQNESSGLSPKSSRLNRQLFQDRSSRAFEDFDSDLTVSTKRSSRIEMRKNSITMQQNEQTAPIKGHVSSPSKDSGRHSKLRSSTGSSSASSSVGRGLQSSPPPSLSRKEPVIPGISSKLSFSKQDGNNVKNQSFSMTISPTTIRAQKNFAATSSTVSKMPISSTSTAVRDSGEMLMDSSSGSMSLVDNALPGCSSNDGSNSNSLETCDPLLIRNDWTDTNSADAQTSKPVTKKKKKRTPVTIHDHITILSGDPPLYQCNVCMKKFKTKAHIKYHEFCQNGEKPYKCEQCGQGFIAKSHYEYHLRTHTGERPYVCPKCGKGFNQRGKVTRHMRSHTGEKPFICQQCGRGFANAQALRSHFLIHTGERPFACQYCNKRFTGMTNLKKHVITHTGERPFTCDHCGKSFGLKWTLDLHLRTHSTERPFACDQCTRAFSNSKDLRRHLVIHSGERPFKCWICGTAFRRKDNLDRHIKNTHNQPKEVAKQLANEAAAEYMAQSKQNQANQVSNPPTETATIPPGTLYSSSNRNASIVDPVPSTSRSSLSNADDNSSKKDSSNMGVIITADLSPPVSPNTVGSDVAAGVADVYILPNGQSGIHPNSHRDTGSMDVGSQNVRMQMYDGLAELRTVPVSEYHQIEGIQLLEKAKTKIDTIEAEEKELHNTDLDSSVTLPSDNTEKHLIEGTSDLIFCGSNAPTTSNQNFNRGLTVTVVYENDGKTHFITDQPSTYAPAVSALNFPAEQSGLLALPGEALFSFGPNDPTTVEEENPQSDESDTPPRNMDMQKKKSDTILTGNLSKFLQMDLPKSMYSHKDGSGSFSDDSLSESNTEDQPTLHDGLPAANQRSNLVDQKLGANCLLNQGMIKGEIVTGDDSEEQHPVSDQSFRPFPLRSYKDSSCTSDLPVVSNKKTFQKEVTNVQGNKGGDSSGSSNPVNDKLDSLLIIKREIEDVDYGKDKVSEASRTKGITQSQSFAREESAPASKLLVSKDSSDVAMQDRMDYPSDPMFQDHHIADDEEKLQESEDVDQQLELPHDIGDKESVDTILPDGIEQYGSPETIFQDKIVDSGHKMDESAQSIVLLKDIVDKECPASILQDEASNCGSVDMISDEEDDDFRQPLVPYREANKSASKEPLCTEKVSGKPKEVSNEDSNLDDILDASSNRIHDNDTESISSTELEPMPDERKVYEREFEGIVDEVCPESILEGDEDNSTENIDTDIRLESTSKPADKESIDSEKQTLDERCVKSPCFSDQNAAPATSSVISDVCTDISSPSLEPCSSPPMLGVVCNLESKSEDSSDYPGRVKGDNKGITQSLKNPHMDIASANDGSSTNSEVGHCESTDVEPISDTELEDLDGDNMDTSDAKRVEETEAPINGSTEVTYHLEMSQITGEMESNSGFDIVNVVGESSVSEALNDDSGEMEVEESADNEQGLRLGTSNAEDTSAGSTHSADSGIISEVHETDKEAEVTSASRHSVSYYRTEESAQQNETNVVSDQLSLSPGTARERGEDGIPYQVQCDPDEEVETAEKSTQCLNTEDFGDFSYNDDESLNNSDEQMTGGIVNQPPNNEQLLNFKMLPTLKGANDAHGSDKSVSASNMLDSTSECGTKSIDTTFGEDAEVKLENSDDAIELPESPSPENVKTELQKNVNLVNVGDSAPKNIPHTGDNFECDQNSRDSTESLSSKLSIISSEPTHEYQAVSSSSTPLPSLSQTQMVYSSAMATASSQMQPSSYSQPSVTSYENPVSPSQTENSDSNYSFVYAPEVPTTVSFPTKQSSFRFVYDNGEPVTEPDPSDNNMRIVYACAAATADPPGDNTGPQKVKLLYAEALGVGTPDDSGQVQLVYTSTAPNQNIVRGPNQNVQIYTPTLLAADTSTNAENIQMLFAQQTQEQNSAPVPVEVLYNGNGTVMAQTVGQLHDLSWIKRDMNHTYLSHPQSQHDKHNVSYSSNSRVSTDAVSTREIANHHNYASNPYLDLDNDKRNLPTTQYEQESDGLQTLARAAATRMFNIQADADATTRAAAAIAAVGRQAQMRRQRDIIERSCNLPPTTVFVRKGENVPHRGPRKRYLSQLTNSRK